MNFVLYCTVASLAFRLPLVAIVSCSLLKAVRAATVRVYVIHSWAGFSSVYRMFLMWFCVMSVAFTWLLRVIRMATYLESLVK